MSNSMDVHVKCITDEVFAINTYCIESDNRAIIIDPILTSSLLDYLKEHEIDFMLLTHEHYDHIYSVNDIKGKYDIKVICGEKALKRLNDPSANMSRYVDYIVDVIPFGHHNVSSVDYKCYADDTVYDGQVIDWKGHSILIKETPGHSIGSISILIDGKYLFSGDVVFKTYPTATRMPGGSTKAFKTITEPWLDSLSQDVVVYPGHTEPFLLKERYVKLLTE